MLKFDIRKQPSIPHLTDILVNKLVEEANEVKEALYDSNISGPAYIQELLDVQQTLLAIFGQYKVYGTFGIIEHAMEEHNKKLATSHKNKYGLGDIMYIGQVDIYKPGDDPIEKLEKDNDTLMKQLKETSDKLRRVQDNCKARFEEYRGTIRELQCSKDNLVMENMDLKHKLNTDTVASLQQQLVVLKRKYNLSTEANRQLREEIDQLRIENGEYREVIQGIENYIKEMKRQHVD